MEETGGAVAGGAADGRATGKLDTAGFNMYGAGCCGDERPDALELLRGTSDTDLRWEWSGGRSGEFTLHSGGEREVDWGEWMALEGWWSWEWEAGWGRRGDGSLFRVPWKSREEQLGVNISTFCLFLSC